MDNRIDAIYGRQSIDKKDSISIESQFEFCRYELKGGEGREYKDKGSRYQAEQFLLQNFLNDKVKLKHSFQELLHIEEQIIRCWLYFFH